MAVAGYESEVVENEKKQRNYLKNKGLSIRQIERLTGISFAIIRRI
jgi:hypothetical protein